MGKYEIKDAIMLKEIMKQLAVIKVKYPNIGYYLDHEEDLKNAIEFIQDMVDKNV